MVGRLEHLFVEITNKCSLFCVHCSSEASNFSKNEIPFSRLTQLVDEGVPLGLKTFTISGGEPLLYPNIFDLIQYIKRKNIKVCLYTCGVIKDNDKVVPIRDEYISRLCHLGVDKIIFSLHGSTKYTHEKITQTKNSFDIVIDSIKKVARASIPFEVHFVPTALNYNEIEGIVQISQFLGAEQVSLLRLVPQGRCVESVNRLLINHTIARNIVQTVNILREKYNSVNIRLGSPFNCIQDSNITNCTASKNKLLISAQGEAFPCEAFKSLKGRMNSIYEHTIEYIWNNDNLLDELRNLKLKHIEYCCSCPYLQSCQGGCPGQRLLSNGNINKGPEVWCKLNFGGDHYVRDIRQNAY